METRTKFTKTVNQNKTKNNLVSGKVKLSERKEKDMDDWKVRIQYVDEYEVKMDLTEKQAKKIFNDMKSKMYEKQVVWCELIHDSLDADDEFIVDDFENTVLKLMGHKVVV